MRDDMNKGYSGESYHSHRAYRDPTADAAIANIMREERLKQRKVKCKAETARRKKYPKVGVWHAEK